MDHKREGRVTPTKALGVWTYKDCALVLIDYQRYLGRSSSRRAGARRSGRRDADHLGRARLRAAARRAREKTMADVVEIVLTQRLLKE
jgi:hypothetical protein